MMDTEIKPSGLLELAMYVDPFEAVLAPGLKPLVWRGFQ